LSTPSVLITAWRGKEPEASRALKLLDDPDRSFASSVFVKLEALPFPKFNRHLDEIEFLEGFFSAVQFWADSPAAVIDRATPVAEKAGRPPARHPDVGERRLPLLRRHDRGARRPRCSGFAARAARPWRQRSETDPGQRLESDPPSSGFRSFPSEPRASPSTTRLALNRALDLGVEVGLGR
jgi:hypothetical protein